ncbi:ferritin-like domain-containing protein [Microbispora hainanensis]|uniref:ferritin-like domain-containing protein n=1 Tax=Microbispora hainanensis TaxID=568844 RepID=UPI002E2AAEA8|nr:ferritin-like domain-containing protein [Microbispora hainanensis]
MTESAAEPSKAPTGDALDRALSAEHAAVYAYGVIGGKTSGALLKRATAGFDAHRARRDQLRTLITRRGGTPAEPGPTYLLPFEVREPADAVRLAVLVEQRVTTAYLELAADRDPALRRLAALAAQECATRAYGWQPKIGDPFPGMGRGGADVDAAPAEEAGSEEAGSEGAGSEGAGSDAASSESAGADAAPGQEARPEQSAQGGQ